DPGDRLQGLDLKIVLVADHADDRPRDALAQVGRQAQGRDPLEHVLDDLRRRMRLQHDDHSSSSGRFGDRRPSIAGRRGQSGLGRPRRSTGCDRMASSVYQREAASPRSPFASWNDPAPGMNLRVYRLAFLPGRTISPRIEIARSRWTSEADRYRSPGLP